MHRYSTYCIYIHKLIHINSSTHNAYIYIYVCVINDMAVFDRTQEGERVSEREREREREE